MATVTVEDVLWLALPPGSVPLVGETLNRPVTGSILLRPTPPALPNLRGGELVLISPASLAALDEGLDLRRFIERLVGAPVAGIAALGAIDEEAQMAAHGAGFPLLLLPEEADLREIQREIQRLLNDREAQMERRAAQLFSTLTREALHGGNLPALLVTLRRWTGREARYLPGRPGRPAGVPVVVGGRQVGAIQIDGAHPWYRLAAEQGAAAFALLLDKERAVQAAEDRFRGELAEMLVSGMSFDLEATMRRATDMGYDLSRPHAVLLLLPENSISPERLETALRRELERTGQRAPLGRRAGAILCLYPPAVPSGIGEELRAIHQRLLAAGFTSSGGMSGAGPLESLPAAAGESEQALLLGRRIFGPGHLVSADDLGIYRLLLLLNDRPEVQEFYARTIGRLVAYEDRPNGDLLQTLMVYCAKLGNYTRAAEALHVHRNTLLYRLRRIEQITGMDLENEEDRLALQIGLRIHRLLQARQRGG
ncbi:MAG: CdaR family transcriptional regulator [Herpetosiphonaceae bacterium]|nr:MAG: CdaR family transcriptional regulator [Herpetosiphonaceae bacterium]